MRRRADSGATERDEGSEKAGGGGGDKGGKKLSMAGWGMSWGSKSGGKNRDKFASLRGSEDAPGRASDDDSDGDDDDGRRSTKSSRSRTGKSPKAPPALLRSTSTNKSNTSISALSKDKKQKRARALFDYVAAADDELGFRQGDELIVLNEVSDTWWMGSLNGKTGLFPLSYVTVLDSRSAPVPPPLAPRRPTADRLNDTDTDTAASLSAADDEPHPFGDHLLVSHRTPVYATFDQRSISSAASDTEDDERTGLARRPTTEPDSPTEQQRWRPSQTASTAPVAPPRLPPRTSTLGSSSPSISSVSISSTTPSVSKKAPPPPPPRRHSILAGSTSSLSVSSTPPIPPRAPPPVSRSYSAGAGLSASLSALAKATTASPVESPFDSTTDLTSAGTCKEFKQHPFKPRGMCANCFEQHG